MVSNCWATVGVHGMKRQILQQSYGGPPTRASAVGTSPTTVRYDAFLTHVSVLCAFACMVNFAYVSQLTPLARYPAFGVHHASNRYVNQWDAWWISPTEMAEAGIGMCVDERSA